MVSKYTVKDLKSKLKENGYNRNMVSVRNNDYEIDITIKDDSVDYIIVKRIVEKYNSRSIIIDYEKSLKNTLVDKLREYSKKIFNIKNEDNCLNMFFENENYKLFYNYRDEQLLVEDKQSNCLYPEMIEKFNVHTMIDLNYCLMRVCLRYKINLVP